MGETVSIYVSSFDSYADVLPPFFARFFKNWPDCDYQVYLGGVNTIFADDRVRTLRTSATELVVGSD